MCIRDSAKAMIAEKGADKVINATIGSLLDDNGNLVVLSSVDEVFKHCLLYTSVFTMLKWLNDYYGEES